MRGFETTLKSILLPYLWHTSGIMFVLVAGSSYCWNTPFFWIARGGILPATDDKWLFLAGIIGVYVAAQTIARRIVSMPLCGRTQSVFLGVSSSFGFFIVLFFTSRAYYSRPFLVIALIIYFFWIFIGQRLFFSVNQIRYGFTPGTIIPELQNEWRDNFVEITNPDSSELFDILVVSPYQDHPLPAEWTRYITNMMVHGVPMAHPGMVYEFFFGRLPLKYMIEGPGVVIRPPKAYLYFKYLFDWSILAVLALPSLLFMGVLSLAILCFSGRPVFFTQERVGKNGLPFRMIKFRSMTETGEITAVGRLLRKYRLDELPQIWNVLRGEMSFIGPRPETLELTRQYTDEIPFYQYRYSILPGISGWAQVNYGYAAVTSENKIKLSFDLYYVKHASFLLDILIFLKTIKTMIVGFNVK